MDEFANFEAQFENTVNKAVGSTEKRDPNQFKPGVTDKNPEYTAVLRFVPPAEGPMFVKKVVHFMKIGKDTVRVICPKTHGDKNRCNICSDNIQGHKSKEPALVKRATDHGNKIRWVANVLVVDDKRFPENNGKVMWWEFPDQIMTMINELNNPPTNDIPAINAFHPTKGVNLFFSMKLIKKFPKYEGTRFITMTGPSAIGEIDYIRQVRSLCHPLEHHQIVTPEDEALKILEKANASSNVVDKKVFSNLTSDEHHAPSMTGIGRAPQSQPDEFDAAFENAGLVAAGREPKRPMEMPATPSRVAPVPEAPAQAVPHGEAPKVDDWLQDI